ncbi:MAG: hypothetical protein BWY66_00259 [bacterium ADurb.Bin374]|nr:MAG: hypothetical protein BWY66_00259 [bacterium ADurb.Bin374]
MAVAFVNRHVVELIQQSAESGVGTSVMRVVPPTVVVATETAGIYKGSGFMGSEKMIVNVAPPAATAPIEIGVALATVGAVESAMTLTVDAVPLATLPARSKNEKVYCPATREAPVVTEWLFAEGKLAVISTLDVAGVVSLKMTSCCVSVASMEVIVRVKSPWAGE